MIATPRSAATDRAPLTVAGALSIDLVERIDALLPQTQCRKCGFDGCRPYAHAIVHSEAPINRCPPGGQAGIHALAELLGREALPLDPGRGMEQPLRRAIIEEAHCIGCTLCIQACPVDAIIGGPKKMHVVIDALCTGCELCVAPCPVDCVRMVAPVAEPSATPSQALTHWTADRADAARTCYLRREARLARQRASPIRAARPVDQARTNLDQPVSAQTAKRAVIAAAIARSRAKRARLQAPRLDETRS